MSGECDNRLSKLDDIEAALRRSAAHARRVAAKTKTPIVLVRDGKIVEEYVSRDELEHLPVPKGPRLTEDPF